MSTILKYQSKKFYITICDFKGHGKSISFDNSNWTHVQGIKWPICASIWTICSIPVLNNWLVNILCLQSLVSFKSLIAWNKAHKISFPLPNHYVTSFGLKKKNQIKILVHSHNDMWPAVYSCSRQISLSMDKTSCGQSKTRTTDKIPHPWTQHCVASLVLAQKKNSLTMGTSCDETNLRQNFLPISINRFFKLAVWSINKTFHIWNKLYKTVNS